jgi:hypothetical protein
MRTITNLTEYAMLQLPMYVCSSSSSILAPKKIAKEVNLQPLWEIG